MIFDPAQFYVYPDGAAILRRDMGPCPCGCVVFVRLSNALGRTRTVCPKCVRPKADESIVEQVRMRPQR